jgi:hypothetical protein
MSDGIGLGYSRGKSSFMVNRELTFVAPSIGRSDGFQTIISNN